jgi:sterol desaturase/sphingolipid hydroxylase (fatty acid hydroxylase superfamily)
MLRTLVALAVLSALFAVVEWRWPANARSRRREGLGTDVGYWFLVSLVTKPLTQASIALALVLLQRTDLATVRERLMHPTSWTGMQPLWLQAIEMLVLGDVIGYVLHRTFHGRRLWRFHAVHHSSTELDWLSAVRVHPVNEWLPRLVTVVVLVSLGFSSLAIAAYVPALALYAILLHANVRWSFGWIGHVIASPLFHRWHHAAEEEALGKNFAGLFPWIDRLGGTYHLPPDRVPERFGVTGDPVPSGLWRQLTYPLSTRSAGAT